MDFTVHVSLYFRICRGTASPTQGLVDHRVVRRWTLVPRHRGGTTALDRACGLLSRHGEVRMVSTVKTERRQGLNTNQKGCAADCLSDGDVRPIRRRDQDQSRYQGVGDDDAEAAPAYEPLGLHQGGPYASSHCGTQACTDAMG